MSELLPGFHRTMSGRFVVKVDSTERGLLLSVARQVIDLVRPADLPQAADPLAYQWGWAEDDGQAPDDPAVARLLPSGYAEEEDARDFRRFTERDLRSTKVRHATDVVGDIEGSGKKIVTTVPDSWLGLLNDARLAIGTRIQISEDNHDELAGLPDGDPRVGLLHVYDWLTFLQESLVRCLNPTLYGFDDDEIDVVED